jgi:DNA-binding Xre family transcriptional regulator
VNNTTSSIHFDTLDRISELLDVPVGDLFEQTPNEKK